jgi:hypothetical protein
LCFMHGEQAKAAALKLQAFAVSTAAVTKVQAKFNSTGEYVSALAPASPCVFIPVPSTPAPGSGTPASNPGSSNKRAKMMSPDEVRSPTVAVRACCDISPLSRVLHSLYCALLFVQLRYEQHERHHSEQMDLLRVAVTPPSHTTASAGQAPPASEAPLCTVRTRLKKWTKADVRAWFTAAAGR